MLINFPNIFVQRFLLARAAQTFLLDEINVDLSIPELLFSSNQHYPFYLSIPILPQ